MSPSLLSQARSNISRSSACQPKWADITKSKGHCRKAPNNDPSLSSPHVESTMTVSLSAWYPKLISIAGHTRITFSVRLFRKSQIGHKRRLRFLVLIGPSPKKHLPSPQDITRMKKGQHSLAESVTLKAPEELLYCRRNATPSQ